MKLAWHQLLLFSISLILLIGIAFQYPLTSTFPMGGDAAAYIIKARGLVKHPTIAFGVLFGTWYPGIYAIFAPATLLPFVSWPVKFMWWMAFGQIAAGLSLGRAVWKTGGPTSSALAIGLWACTPIILTPMFEDGTLAQLWSLPFLILFLDSFIHSQMRKASAYMLATFATHPISAIVVTLSFLIAAPFFLWRDNHLTYNQKKIILLSVAVLVATLALVITWRSEVIRLPFIPEHSPYSQELLFGSFERWFMLAIPGFYLLCRKLKKDTPASALFPAFIFMSSLLAFNDKLGIGFWTGRLSPYLLIATIWCAAYAFPRLLHRLIQYRAVCSLIAITLLLVHGFGTFTDNQRTLALYDSPSRYLRTTDDEIDAILWLRNHTPSSQRILTSNANRHTEWLGALTNIPYAEVPDHWIQKKLQEKEAVPDEIILLLKRRESIPKELMAMNPAIILYENKDVVVLSLNKLP